MSPPCSDDRWAFLHNLLTRDALLVKVRESLDARGSGARQLKETAALSALASCDGDRKARYGILEGTLNLSHVPVGLWRSWERASMAWKRS